MKLNLYSVHDEKAQVFTHMFFRRNHGEAIRYFGDACRDDKTVLFKHPADFSLYYHGSINDESGHVDAVIPVQFIARGSEFFSVPTASTVGSTFGLAEEVRS